MVPTARRLSGDNAENLALTRLQRSGLRLVARNYRCRHGEIDLIMTDGECLVFVEVRFRGGRAKSAAIATVDARKQRKLVHTAAVFLSRHPVYRQHACRFDVVGVDACGQDRVELTWLTDAFRAL